MTISMLPPDNRLKKVRDFNLIIKHGRWTNGRFLDIKTVELAKIKDYFPTKENPDKFVNQLKIAFSVGIKISKSAVTRNRVRRQLREAVRLLLKENNARRGWYILVLAKKEAIDKNFAEIKQEMELLYNKIKLFNN